MSADTFLETKHPAPERNKASLWSLSFSLAAPPLAWSVQSIVGYSISSEACYPGDTPRTLPLFAGLWDLLLGINGVALGVGVLGILIAYRNWSATRRETGGDSEHLIERGEGRTRFIAMCGLLLGAGFVVATAFTSVTLLLSPLCR
jgi:hypothetical protein